MRHRPSIILVNPLGVALAHYAQALQSHLSDHEIKVTYYAFPEPSQSRAGRFHWWIEYWRHMKAVSKVPADAIIVLWPVMGYLDALLFRLVARMKTPIFLVVHDPRPLVRAMGYSPLSRLVASLPFVRLRTIVHSSSAKEYLTRNVRVRSCDVMPHPITVPMHSPSSALTPPGSYIRVLGQYKPDRDIDILKQLPLAGPPACYEIVGRGWPMIDGWEVQPEFVSEQDFHDLLRSSTAIIIPYRFFFQSGVAIRSIEHMTAFVGPAGSHLEDLLGPSHPWLARDEYDWVRALHAAADSSALERSELHSRIYAETQAMWGHWIQKQILTR